MFREALRQRCHCEERPQAATRQSHDAGEIASPNPSLRSGSGQGRPARPRRPERLPKNYLPSRQLTARWSGQECPSYYTGTVGAGRGKNAPPTTPEP
jgi:hypothetical protein